MDDEIAELVTPEARERVGSFAKQVQGLERKRHIRETAKRVLFELSPPPQSKSWYGDNEEEYRGAVSTAVESAVDYAVALEEELERRFGDED